MHNKVEIIFVKIVIGLACLALPKLTLANDFELPNDIKFSGVVIDSTPIWSWRIHDTAQERASNWDADAKDGITEGNGTTRFIYTEKNSEGLIAFLQGVMNASSSLGTPDILPRITVYDDQGTPIILNGDTSTQHVSILAIGNRSNGSLIDGLLTFNVSSAYGNMYKVTTDSKTVYSESYEGSVGWAATSILLSNLPADYRLNEKGEVMTTQYDRFESSYSIASLLSGSRAPEGAFSIIGSFTSHLSDINTIWSEIPISWAATLSVEVEIP